MSNHHWHEEGVQRRKKSGHVWLEQIFKQSQGRFCQYYVSCRELPPLLPGWKRRIHIVDPIPCTFASHAPLKIKILFLHFVANITQKKAPTAETISAFSDWREWAGV